MRAIYVFVLAVLSKYDLLLEGGLQDLQLPCLSIVCIPRGSVNAGSISTFTLYGAHGCAPRCREKVLKIELCCGIAFRRCNFVVHCLFFTCGWCEYVEVLLRSFHRKALCPSLFVCRARCGSVWLQLQVNMHCQGSAWACLH